MNSPGHADAVHVSTGYSVLPSPPIPTGRQVQGVAGALALAGADEGAFGNEVGQVAGGGRPGGAGVAAAGWWKTGHSGSCQFQGMIQTLGFMNHTTSIS